MKNPSKKQLNRARWARERQAFMEAEKGYREDLVWPGLVRLWYCGHLLEFVPHEHTIAISGYFVPYMPPEDHSFLFHRAKRLLKAAEKGAKEAAKRKAAKTEEERSTNTVDPRQPRLL